MGPFDILREYNASRDCADHGSICHAPENSIYFGRDGLVSACCYSRSRTLGRYPDQSIEEIWTGGEAQSMRAALRRNELPAGCELCADQFNARNFRGFHARQFDETARPLSEPAPLPRAGTSRMYPVRLEFELSNKCNLECSMCSGFYSSSIRANREKLPPLPQIYDKAFIQQLLPFLPHLKWAKFLGGEPFLVDIYYEIWDRLIELNPECNVSITTNGTVLTSKVRRVLEKLNCSVVVSLDSVTKATYETIRKNASLERTLANLEVITAINLRKNKGSTLAICPMSSNWREIPELVTFANERGMRVFFNTVVFPAAHSIKVAPTEVQRKIVDLYRNSCPEPRTESELRNRDAVQDFCRQIEHWMAWPTAAPARQTAAPTPMMVRCAELLACGIEPDSVACVLSDLAGNSARGGGQTVFHIEGSDPVHELKERYRAMWTVGEMLQSSGLLPELRFDRDDLQVFLRYLDGNVRPETARRIHFEIRRFPNEAFRFCGTLAPSQLIELVVAHFASSPAMDAKIDFLQNSFEQQ